jgi:hypothetical protein
MRETAPNAAGGGEPLRYPIATLYADYLRAGLGLALTAGPLLLLDLADGIALVLAALALLFAWFGVRTVLRQLSRVELSGNAIAVHGPFSRRVAWADLEHMKLAYYAPRRSRDQGWLQLTLRATDGGAIQVDSTLPEFDQVLDKASRAARDKALPLDAATCANLAALGFEAAGEGAPPVSSLAPDPAAAVRRRARARW